MNYISPIKLFHEELNFETKEITVRELSLIRRKLMAEAELSEQKTIVRDGVTLSKDDIVNLFDQLEKNMRLDFHLRLFNNKPLLTFLETGIYDFADVPVNTDEIKADAEFRDFIQPWFIPVWTEVLLDELRHREFYNLTVLMQLGNDIVDEFLLPDILHSLEAKLWDFESSSKELSERIRTSRTGDQVELDVYISNDLILFLNELPYTFSGFRNTYMIAMVNITVQLFNSGHRGLAITYGNMAIKLESDDFYKNQMIERLALYKRRRAPVSSSGGNSTRYWWVIVMIISALVRIGSCNDNSDMHAFRDINNTYGVQGNVGGSAPNQFIPRETKEFFLYRADNKYNYTGDDSSRIVSVTRARGNAVFLYRLVNLLRKNIEHLPVKNYPEPNAGYYDMAVSALSDVIDSGWNKDYEENSLSPQNARAIIYNNTNTPMFLLYKYGTHLVPITIVPGNYREVEFEPGYTIIAPFFGIGWDKNKKVYENINDKYSLLNQGWFINKPKGIENPANNITLLNIQPDEPYADTIRFSYNLVFGYSATIIGNNIKKVNSPSL